jgi:hypothetical protein
MKKALLLALAFCFLAISIVSAEEAQWNLTWSEQWASQYLTNSGRVFNKDPGMTGTIVLTSPTGWGFGIWRYYSFSGGSPLENKGDETDYFVNKHLEFGKWELEPALTFQDYSSRPWDDVIQPSFDVRYKLIEGKWSLRAFYRLEVPINMTGDIATAHYIGARVKTYVKAIEFFLEPFFTTDDGRMTGDAALVFATKAGVSVPLKKIAPCLNDFSLTTELKATTPVVGGEKTIKRSEVAGYFGVTYSHNFLK